MSRVLFHPTHCPLLNGNSWSPLHELIPDPPLRHGHAISIDMAYSATLSLMRGLLSPEDHLRLLRLFSRAGLSMDHHQFDGPLLGKATAAILRTRDGKLRLAVPVSPIGKCVFVNDVSHEEMCKVLEMHKNMVAAFPRQGNGLDAFVDSSDTGYGLHGASTEGDPSEEQNESNHPMHVSLRSIKPMDDVILSAIPAAGLGDVAVKV